MSLCVDQVLHYHLRFYQLLGLHGLPLSGDVYLERNSRVLRLWGGCLLISFSGVALLCLISDDAYLYPDDGFGYFNDAMKYGFAELAVLSIYVETMWQRSHQARFWKLYAELATTTTPTPTPPLGNVGILMKRHRRYLIAFYGTLLTEMVLLGMFVCLQDITRNLLLFWTTFQPFVFVVHLRNTQFVLHLEVVRQQIRQLDSELALLVEYSGFASGAASFPGFEDYLRRQLREKQLIYERIYELCFSFRRSFSYSMLTVLLMIYIRIAVDCYFMLYTVHNNINNIDYFLILPAVLHVVVLIYASQSCMQMVPRIAYQLHNIVANSPALSLQIQNFSLQMLHEPVRIDCLGIIILDSHLLTRTACAVSTYMIYTTQLMPKLSGPSE
ncbi:gustatory receptor 8a [Drosophila grimshawi]|uniref:Gustatory receptor n=1 Tax=Drosophila grimshawi TaxID=7222 RepID=B4JKN6_DROGR|nr:gustatory receptor 8a [Drosophila grimshawi]EDW00139.1 GH12027 [Drosophila grimshawi]